MARGRSGALFFPRLVMKQSKRLIWPFAVSMALAGEGPAAAPNFQELPLTAQSRSLPSDFKDHFFDVPLAMRVEIDGQGRIRLPERLVGFAQLKQDVVLLGVHDHIEIWDQGVWNAFLQEHSQGFDRLANEALA